MPSQGLYASGAPVVLALWRMFFGKACYERGGEREARKQSARTPVDTRFGPPRMRRVSHDGNGTKPGREGTYLRPAEFHCHWRYPHGGDDEWFDLSRWLGRCDYVHSLLPGTSLMAPRILTEGPRRWSDGYGRGHRQPDISSLEPDRRWRNRRRGSFFCPHLLRIGSWFGGGFAVVELA